MGKKWTITIVLMLLVSLSLTACDKRMMFVGSSTKNKIGASYKLFTGTEEKKLKLKKGETLSMEYKSEVKKGELSMKLYGPGNQLLKELNTNEAGNEKLEASEEGKYRFEIKGNDTKGNFEIAYKIE